MERMTDRHDQSFAQQLAVVALRRRQREIPGRAASGQCQIEQTPRARTSRQAATERTRGMQQAAFRAAARLLQHACKRPMRSATKLPRSFARSTMTTPAAIMPRRSSHSLTPRPEQTVERGRLYLSLRRLHPHISIPNRPARRPNHQPPSLPPSQKNRSIACC